MALDLTDRLSSLDKDQLLNLRANARRLQADAGPKTDEAAALLPLIDAELAKRAAAVAVKAAPKRKRVTPPPAP